MTKLAVPVPPGASATLVALACLLLGTISPLGARAAGAQTGGLGLAGGLPVGSEGARYLRLLQVAGMADTHTSLSGELTPGELRRIVRPGGHPWAERFQPPAETAGGPYAGLLASSARMVYNSSFPYGDNDGPVWAGRGLTASLEGGVYAGFGPLHVRMAPQAFEAENAPFELIPNGLTGANAWRDAKYPWNIDHPQRFGDESYRRLDGGASSVTLDVGLLRFGASTAGEQWGPAIDYPLVLSNNAGGFQRLFAETHVDLWALQAHARLIAGEPMDSEFAPVDPVEPRRLATGAVVVLIPRPLPGLEIGFTRFIHAIWPADGVTAATLLEPLRGRITFDQSVVELGNPRAQNQIGGAFMHLTLPAGGFEAYVEYMREDFPRNWRHVLVEPDDLTGRTIGVRKVTRSAGTRLWALRAEAVTSEVSHSERADRFRIEGSFGPLSPYQHWGVLQGHTLRGQLLASPTAYAGSGWTLGFDLYHPAGRWTAELRRALRTDWYAALPGESEGVADVTYALKLEALLFRDGWEALVGATPAWSLNHNVVDGEDALNLNLQLGVSGFPW